MNNMAYSIVLKTPFEKKCQQFEWKQNYYNIWELWWIKLWNKCQNGELNNGEHKNGLRQIIKTVPTLHRGRNVKMVNQTEIDKNLTKIIAIS